MAARVLDAFESILEALFKYRTNHEKLDGRLQGHLGKLGDAREKDRDRLLHAMLANPEHEPGLLSVLWRNAVGLGTLRQQGGKRCKTVEVLVNGSWIAATAQSPWYVLLTRNATRFGEIVDRAIADIKPIKPSDSLPNYVRRLRGITKKPTSRRLRNFVRDAAAAKGDATDIIQTGFSFAGRRTGIFPDELPSDWLERVAGQPQAMKRLAQAFLELVEVSAREPWAKVR